MIRKFGLVSAMALATALGGCAMMPDLGFGTASGSDMPPLPASAAAPAVYPRDAHTYARPEIAHVRHVALDLTADFRAQTLSGTAALDIQGATGATEVVLDIKNLDIRGVSDASGAPLPYETGALDAIKISSGRPNRGKRRNPAWNQGLPLSALPHCAGSRSSAPLAGRAPGEVTNRVRKTSGGQRTRRLP